ncbi:hypothetical protein EVAR_73864_1 [Eumeta japonica]|uniref:Uncharacterized protein n=1 Tax=Eumeta variegata TaxID=151549 RepID=A0A4C1TBC0_EUMVA|nr:hypothetical protein EVAR_73864_1 [Eumeta japonica]
MSRCPNPGRAVCPVAVFASENIAKQSVAGSSMFQPRIKYQPSTSHLHMPPRSNHFTLLNHQIKSSAQSHHGSLCNLYKPRSVLRMLSYDMTRGPSLLRFGYRCISMPTTEST